MPGKLNKGSKVVRKQAVVSAKLEHASAQVSLRNC